MCNTAIALKTYENSLNTPLQVLQEITEQLLKLQANPGNITFPGFFFSPWKRGGTGENRVKITGLAARL